MPTCTVASLVEAFPCFQFPTTNDHKKMALLVYFNVLELAALGGTDYRETLTTTLVTASNIFQNLTNDQLGVGIVGTAFPGVATLAINFNNATSAGATPSTNIQTLATATVGLNALTDRQLSQAYLLLQCKLGRHTGT